MNEKTNLNLESSFDRNLTNNSNIFTPDKNISAKIQILKNSINQKKNNLSDYNFFTTSENFCSSVNLKKVLDLQNIILNEDFNSMNKELINFFFLLLKIIFFL